MLILIFKGTLMQPISYASLLVSSGRVNNLTQNETTQVKTTDNSSFVAAQTVSLKSVQYENVSDQSKYILSTNIYSTAAHHLVMPTDPLLSHTAPKPDQTNKPQSKWRQTWHKKVDKFINALYRNPYKDKFNDNSYAHKCARKAAFFSNILGFIYLTCLLSLLFPPSIIIVPGVKIFISILDAAGYPKLNTWFQYATGAIGAVLGYMVGGVADVTIKAYNYVNCSVLKNQNF